MRRPSRRTGAWSAAICPASAARDGPSPATTTTASDHPVEASHQHVQGLLGVQPGHGEQQPFVRPQPELGPHLRRATGRAAAGRGPPAPTRTSRAPRARARAARSSDAASVTVARRATTRSPSASPRRATPPCSASSTALCQVTTSGVRPAARPPSNPARRPWACRISTSGDRTAPDVEPAARTWGGTRRRSR